MLGGKERIILTKPMDYAPFCTLMKESHIILSDSGGVQEEAPSLGKPVLVLRSTTERPEAVKYGTVKLVGTNPIDIISSTQLLLDHPKKYKKMSEAINPYGDGLACQRIVDVLKEGFDNNRLVKKSNIVGTNKDRIVVVTKKDNVFMYAAKDIKYICDVYEENISINSSFSISSNTYF